MGRAPVLTPPRRGPLQRYAHWLHGRWPAGRVERLPVLAADGSCGVPGVYVAGDLTGIPLLKLAAAGGARVVRTILADPAFATARAARPPGAHDLVIVGAGVAGMSAALAARQAGLDFVVLESRRPFQTLIDFPRTKPIFTFPTELRPEGALWPSAEVKEDLLAELADQTRGVEVRAGRAVSIRRERGTLITQLADGRALGALRVIIAVGRSGEFRKLDCPGAEREQVHHRLHDPADFAGRPALVVGGGDAAVETAVALAEAGARVTLCHRGPELARPKPANLARLAAAPVEVLLDTEVAAIRADDAILRRADGESQARQAAVVFAMIGRQAPLDLLRRSGLRIRGAWSVSRALACAAFVLLCVALYDWKSGGALDAAARAAGAFPQRLEADAGAAPPGLRRVILTSAAAPAFWYTLAYSGLVAAFGLRRIRRRRTPYVRVQTLTLAAIQILPLFLLPELILPWLDARGLLPAAAADALFPRVDHGHGREFWRAYGLILAWPLNVYNVFTPAPLPWWLAISFAQTFVLIPLLVWRFGKGAYCGWICSCGALAETLGDTHRDKMPHGPGWNRLNLAGQALLAVALLLLALRVTAWARPDWPTLSRLADLGLSGTWLSWKWTVDVLLAGAIGYGCYFWFSGRVWCRFFCPLAALMHVYARFSRFRILADKQRCISCNACTASCHQGIDVMSFANRGLPMADPQCVRCSACVAACPTGVLAFGRVDRSGRAVARDRLAASPLRLHEPALASPTGFEPVSPP